MTNKHNRKSTRKDDIVKGRGIDPKACADRVLQNQSDIAGALFDLILYAQEAHRDPIRDATLDSAMRSVWAISEAGSKSRDEFTAQRRKLIAK